MDRGQIKIVVPHSPAGIGRIGFETLFEPYAKELGILIFAWNALSEAMARIFAAVATPDAEEVGLAVWQELKSDLTQREILLAASVARLDTNSERDKHLIENIKYLVEECRPLSTARNNAIHAPYSYLLADDGPAFVASDALKNKKAIALKSKKLLDEFRRNISHAESLNDFAALIERALRDPSLPLPDKPARPVPRRKTSDQIHK